MNDNNEFLNLLARIGAIGGILAVVIIVILIWENIK